MEQIRTELLPVRKCKVISRKGNDYLLDIKFANGGNSRFNCKPETGIVSWGKREHTISENNSVIIYDAVKQFDDSVKELRETTDDVLTAEFSAPDMILHLRKTENHRDIEYEVLFEFDTQSECTFVYKSSYNILQVMNLIQKRYEAVHDEKVRTIINPTPETLHDNPLFIAAYEKKDYIILSLLENLWGKNSVKSAYIPDFSEEFDRKYCVITKTIPILMVYRSGYTVLHRPYFAMMGCTHDVSTINPHKKCVVDAAKIDAPYITFYEFAELLGI